MPRGMSVGEGDPRGDATRRRLLVAALRAFGKAGFDGVGIRAIARDADANIAAIPYHFGSKEGLYLAVADLIVAETGAAIGEAARHARARVSGDDGDAADEALRDILHAMVQGLLGAEDSAARAAFVMREQLDPGPAFDRLYLGFIDRLRETVTLLVARIGELAPEDDAAILRAHALIGQVLAFAIARATALRRLGWDDYDETRVRAIADTVSTLALEALRPQRDRPR